MPCIFRRTNQIARTTDNRDDNTLFPTVAYSSGAVMRSTLTSVLGCHFRPLQTLALPALAAAIVLIVCRSQPVACAADVPAGTQPAANWQSLFDGKTLGKWKASDFAGHGEPAVE